MIRSGWRLAFVLAFAVQCAALYWPRTPAVATGLPLDKVVHVSLFAAVAALGVLSGLPTRWLVIGLALQGVVSELVQGTMPGRSADVRDLLADAAGIMMGVAFGHWARQRSGSTTGTDPSDRAISP